MIKNITIFGMITFLIFISTKAYANAFIPTMVSANAVWLLVLPLVVAVEGSLMAYWKWEKPYKYALFGNLWSMLAALPVGFGLSILGNYISKDIATADSARHLLAQTLLYGQVSTPSYGYISGGSSNGGIILAALLFIGICWVLTFVVEALYYRKKNPNLSKANVYRRTAMVNIASYCLLIALWLPYSYQAAKSEEGFMKSHCAEAGGWGRNCLEILAKYPEIKQQRLRSCESHGIKEDICLKGGYR